MDRAAAETDAIEQWLALAGVLCIVVPIAAQGFGHSLERQQVHPFTGPRDFLRRLYAEQFFNFWRFLCSVRPLNCGVIRR
ncbi:MAG: hypothetical protein AB7T20_10655 [Steroidobacteraceae bacterium]